MAQKEIRILFTSVGRRVELIQSFKEAAEELNVDLVLYGADITETAPALYFCDVYKEICRISNDQYIPSLLNICQENKIDLLIPTIDTDLLILSKNKEKFLNIGTKVFISSVEMITYCRDKRNTAELFEKCGLLAPKSFGDVSKYNLGFPAFIKPLDGSSSINAYKVLNEEELAEYAKKIDGYVIQPFVDGTEYTIDIMCDFEGNPIYITPRERSAVRSGEVLKTKIVQEQQMIEESKKLIEIFKPCGPITVQLIRNKNKEDYFIEINPRFGGGAPLSMKAGANAAKATISMLCGNQLKYQEKAAQNGSIYSRFDQCIYINNREARTAKTVTELIDVYMDYEAVIFDLDDTLYSEKQYVKSGYKEIAKEMHRIENMEEKLWNAFEEGKPAIDTVLLNEGIYSQELKEKCLDIYRNQEPDITLYDNVKEMLKTLRESGKKLGIITDGRVNGQESKLQKLGLYSLVDEVIITDQLAGNGNVKSFRKPNTIAFEIMKKRLNVRYQDMIYVGDNLSKDFKAPKRLGMSWIHVDNDDGIYRENKM